MGASYSQSTIKNNVFMPKIGQFDGEACLFPLGNGVFVQMWGQTIGFKSACSI
jgi:hypothetical protein